MADRNKTIGVRIARVREKAGDKQADLAAALGVKREMVTYWENGMRAIKAEMLLSIADRYGVNADYLLGRTDEATVKEDIRISCKTTGLSECALNNICALNKNEKYLNALNFILEKTAFFREVLSPVVKVLDSLSATDMDEYDASEEELALLDKLEERGYLVGSPFYCATIYSDRAGIALHDILERELFGDSETKRNTAEIERHWWGLFEHQEKEAADNGEQ